MKRYLVFTLDHDLFAIDVDTAVEVMKTRSVKRVPELPEFISGVVNVRREAFPLVEMRQRLGMLSADPSVKGRLLIVRSSLDRIALLVDDVTGIIKIDSSMIKMPKMVFRGLKKRYLEGLYNNDGDMIIILNVEEILTSDEKILLGKARKYIDGKDQ